MGKANAKIIKQVGNMVLTSDNKMFKLGSPEFKKWCKENKVSTGKVNVSSIAPKSKTNEPKVKIKKHKEKKVKYTSSSSETTSKGLLLLTILPMLLVLILTVLSSLGLIQPIANGITSSAENMFENFEFLYLCREVIVDWMNSLDGGWALLLFPLVILAFILGFVLDILLGLLYLLVAFILFLIGLIVGFIFVYALCPGIVILEIVMVQKSFKDKYSIHNKGWSIASMFLSLFLTVVFYICYINIR